MRRALRRLVRSAGLCVEEFPNGSDFLATLADHAPDCVVLDLHMPGTSGFGVQSELRRIAPGLPVIVLTGRDSPESRQRAMSGGAAAYFRKPVDGQTLLDAILAAIGRKGES
ncbi:MAG: response regulator [Phycisphaerae bacterium]|nr:response regulator [Phycisphaerae bacterium]